MALAPSACQDVISTGNGNIEDANSTDTYTPKAGDVGGTLTATASYTDGHERPSRYRMADAF